MLNNFPLLKEEEIKKLTEEGYVLVFRNFFEWGELPKDLVNKKEIDDPNRVVPFMSGDPVTKILNFSEGYEFLKNSDRQYVLRANGSDKLEDWCIMYNLSTTEDEEVKKRFFKYLSKGV